MDVKITSTVVMVIYLLITLGVALLYGRRKTETSSDFTVGGRSFGLIVLFFTMLATIVGAGSVVGLTGWYWIRGLSQIWYQIGIIASFIVFIYYLGPRINKFGFDKGGTTPGDWMAYRYSPTAKYISSFLLMVAFLAITAFQYMAMARIFNQATGISYEWALIITALLVIVYTTIGGLWAIAATDVLQGTITLVGLIILAPIVVFRAGGLSNIVASAPAEHLDLFGYVTPLTALSASLVFFLGIVSWPDVWQRCYAAKNIKTLKQSFWAFVIAALVIMVILVLLLGFGAKALYPEHATPESILPFMIMDQLPVLFGAILMAALIAIIMGTADSTLLISAVIFENDFFSVIKPDATDKEKLKLNRVTTMIGGVIVLILAMTAPSMFAVWIWSAQIIGATLAVPILLGISWKKPTNAAALASIAAGFSGWAVAYLGWVTYDPILLGAGLSLAAYLALTFFGPQNVVNSENLKG